MAQVALPGPSTFPAVVPRLLGWVRVLMPLMLVAGCASWRSPLPIPPEVTQDGVAARVLVPPDLNVNPAETVVKPGDSEPDAPGFFSEPRPRTRTDDLRVDRRHRLRPAE